MKQLRLYPIHGDSNNEDTSRICKQIQTVFCLENRDYLNVFKLESGARLTDTIFQAVLKAKIIHETFEQNFQQQHSCLVRNELRKQQDADTQKEQDLKLLEIAVSWNCIDEAHSILQRMQVCIPFLQAW
jgi:hypothetical protein